MEGSHKTSEGLQVVARHLHLAHLLTALTCDLLRMINLLGLSGGISLSCEDVLMIRGKGWQMGVEAAISLARVTYMNDDRGQSGFLVLACVLTIAMNFPQLFIYHENAGGCGGRRRVILGERVEPAAILGKMNTPIGG